MSVCSEVCLIRQRLHGPHIFHLLRLRALALGGASDACRVLLVSKLPFSAVEEIELELGLGFSAGGGTQ